MAALAAEWCKPLTATGVLYTASTALRYAIAGSGMVRGYTH